MLVFLTGLLAAGLGTASLAAELHDGGRLWGSDLYGGLLVGAGAALALGALRGLRHAHADVKPQAAAEPAPRRLI